MTRVIQTESNTVTTQLVTELMRITITVNSTKVGEKYYLLIHVANSKPAGMTTGGGSGVLELVGAGDRSVVCDSTRAEASSPSVRSGSSSLPERKLNNLIREESCSIMYLLSLVCRYG